MMFSSENSAGDSARLEDYLRAISARKWVVIGSVLGCLALATILASGRTDQYTATATVVLGPTPVNSVNANLVNPNLEKEREIILSNQTASTVVERLGLADTPQALLRNVTVAFRPDSDVISIDYVSTDPEIAASYANAFAEAYADSREGAAVSYYQSKIDLADANLVEYRQTSSDLASEIEEWSASRTDLVTSVAAADRVAELAEIDDQLTRLRAERADVASLIRIAENLKRDDEATLASRSASAEVLRSADAPTTPDGLSLRLLQIAGLLGGFLLGVIAAFLLERLDQTARDDSDVALALSTKVIGSIPSLGFRNKNGRAALVMLTTGGSPRIVSSREAFRRLRSSLQFLMSTDDIKSIIVTSATPSEGKSVVAGNLAIALAQSGKRVALLSADLRRPTQEERFDISTDTAGLSEYLGGSSELSIVDVPEVNNLWVLPAGATPANPGELLGSRQFSHLIAELHSEVDFIVVDTPPILSTADAVTAAGSVDGVVVVVDSSRTESNDLLQVRADLERSGARLIGAVLNKRKYRRGSLFRRDRYAYSNTPVPATAELKAPEVRLAEKV